MLNKNEKLHRNENDAPIVLLGDANFEAEVLQSKQPVLVAFWAPWSQPCQILNPVLHELSSTLAGKATVVRVNADESLGLSLLYDIQSIPTLLYFVEGKLRLRIVGTATKHAILAKLNSCGVVDETLTPKGASGDNCQPKRRIETMFTEFHATATLPPYSAKRNLHHVTFFCHAPEAEQVSLIGDFNDWQPNATPMLRQPNGQWMLSLELSHGYHPYVFLVDGKRVLDPNATGKAKDSHSQPVSLLAIS